jgi:WD domain, G-beta repeat.
MQHTYLRYECADAFSLTTSAATASTLTTSPLAFLSTSNSRTQSILLSTSGSQVIGFNLRTNEPCLKIGYRELLSGGLGTGKALNSNEVLCISTATVQSNQRVATGWKDGSIRVFDVQKDDCQAFKDQKLGLAYSICYQDHASQSNQNEEFVTREPLLLNGHSGSPITCLKFQMDQGVTSILASGSSDGTVILWDILNGKFYFIHLYMHAFIYLHVMYMYTRVSFFCKFDSHASMGIVRNRIVPFAGSYGTYIRFIFCAQARRTCTFSWTYYILDGRTCQSVGFEVSMLRANDCQPWRTSSVFCSFDVAFIHGFCARNWK